MAMAWLWHRYGKDFFFNILLPIFMGALGIFTTTIFDFWLVSAM
jgi:hypothetical protein